jgi:hypothetical protein
VAIVTEEGPRYEFAAELIAALRSKGVRVLHPSPWDDCDARLQLSALVHGELQTSSHPEGFVQVRVRPKIRRRPLLAVLALAIAAMAVTPSGALIFVIIGVSVAQGMTTARRLPRRLLAAPDAV